MIPQPQCCRRNKEHVMSLGTISLVILVIALLGGFAGPVAGPSTGRATMVAAWASC